MPIAVLFFGFKTSGRPIDEIDRALTGAAPPQSATARVSAG
jgi:hypothetical protein